MKNFVEILNEELTIINGGFMVDIPSATEQYTQIANVFDSNSGKHMILYNNYLKEVNQTISSKITLDIFGSSKNSKLFY